MPVYWLIGNNGIEQCNYSIGESSASLVATLGPLDVFHARAFLQL